jgi:glutamate/tyrosine decarboxylase-like PLP-dependent enzyme
MWLTRAVSITNFTVASSALGFQVFVLYPWHEELQHDFNRLREEHLESLRSIRNEVEEMKRAHIRALELVNEPKGWASTFGFGKANDK